MKLRVYLFVLLLLNASFSCFSEEDIVCDGDQAAMIKVVDNLLARPDYMRYGEDGLHYAEACAALGAMRLSEILDREDLLNALIERYEVLMDPETDLVSEKAHVDFSVIGIIPLQIYLSTGEERYLKRGLEFADKQWEQPRENGLTRETRWWIDDMYMVGALQIQAYRATGDIVYAQRAAVFLKAYLDKLQQPNGLFFHGPEAHFYWGRGNGWVASALAETLSSIPDSLPEYNGLVESYIHMMEALLPLQSESGMWRQLIDYPEAWEESSCTAMFAFAMEVGEKNGWLEEDKFKPAVRRAWRALNNNLDEKGNLKAICVGTGQNKDAQYYLDRPRTRGDFHGQAPLLWLATALMDRQ